MRVPEVVAEGLPTASTPCPHSWRPAVQPPRDQGYQSRAADPQGAGRGAEAGHCPTRRPLGRQIPPRGRTCSGRGGRTGHGRRTRTATPPAAWHVERLERRRPSERPPRPGRGREAPDPAAPLSRPRRPRPATAADHPLAPPKREGFPIGPSAGCPRGHMQWDARLALAIAYQPIHLRRARRCRWTMARRRPREDLPRDSARAGRRRNNRPEPTCSAPAPAE